VCFESAVLAEQSQEGPIDPIAVHFEGVAIVGSHGRTSAASQMYPTASAGRSGSRSGGRSECRWLINDVRPARASERPMGASRERPKRLAVTGASRRLQARASLALPRGRSTAMQAPQRSSLVIAGNRKFPASSQNPTDSDDITRRLRRLERQRVARVVAAGALEAFPVSRRRLTRSSLTRPIVGPLIRHRPNLPAWTNSS